ncbi:MAG: hypothetical protein IPO99_15570 [Nitrospira sp.]|nr:hypothetical protein [Nitrospira sp.]
MSSTHTRAPDSITDTETGTIVTYRFLNAKYSRVNFGWLLKPWSPVDPDLVFSRSGLGTDAFELLCDDHWLSPTMPLCVTAPAPPFTLSVLTPLHIRLASVNCRPRHISL